jgi:hypothetical protein
MADCADMIPTVDFAAMVEKLAPQSICIGFLAPSSHCHHPPFRGAIIFIPVEHAIDVYHALVALPTHQPSTQIEW